MDGKVVEGIWESHSWAFGLGVRPITQRLTIFKNGLIYEFVYLYEYEGQMECFG